MEKVILTVTWPEEEEVAGAREMTLEPVLDWWLAQSPGAAEILPIIKEYAGGAK